MKTVKVTMNFEFELNDVDNESIKEKLAELFEEKIENDELLDNAKVKITDNEEDEDLDLEEDDE